MQQTEEIKTEIDGEKLRWEVIGLDCFFKMIRENSVVTADTYRKYARQVEMPPSMIYHTSHGFFRSFSCQGYIKRSKKHALSEYSSQPLPIWTVVKTK
jgi:hypothetical protein